jgi:hypothetical protein
VRFGLTLAALVAASVAPVTLASQTPSPAASGIRTGQTIRDSLVRTDPKFPDGSRYKLYTFVGGKGDTVTFDLTSDDFDANLVVADAAGNRLGIDDDGGGKCNARLQFVPPATGNYRIYANSSSQAELGEYRLSLARGRAPAPADSLCRGFGRVAGLIDVGQTATGTLTTDDPKIPSDSTYFERWILPVNANQTFTVDLVSDDFDAYLLLTKGRGERLLDNDDGGGGCNARLVYTAPDNHPLRIIVNTASRPRGQTGRYTLRVTAGASPLDPKGDCHFNPQTAPQANVATHTIAVGETQQGALTRNDVLLTHDSTYAQAWTIQGQTGQTITIDLESDAFDAFLFLRGPGLSGGRDFQDDDSGGNCNARLTATFPQTADYEIDVNTSDHYATGAFTLSVTSGSKPKSVARCSRSGQ